MKKLLLVNDFYLRELNPWKTAEFANTKGIKPFTGEKEWTHTMVMDNKYYLDKVLEE